MKNRFLSSIFGLFNLNSAKSSPNISDIVVKDVHLNDVKLSSYKGKVLLIVNVASKCGFTKQYEGLQKIYDEYKDKGFVILGFPCNNFGSQEPGSNKQIIEFCSLNYNVTFPIFHKVNVRGNNRSPLFDILTNNFGTGTSSIKWNFEKFLVDKNGNVVERFRSLTEPTSKKIKSSIEFELSK